MTPEKLKAVLGERTPGRWPNYNDTDIREQLWKQYDWTKDRKNTSPIIIPDSDAKAIATMMNLADSLVELWEACETVYGECSHGNHCSLKDGGSCDCGFADMFDALEKLSESGGE